MLTELKSKENCRCGQVFFGVDRDKYMVLDRSKLN